MRIIARNSLIAFWEKHPRTEASLKHWHEVAASATWESPMDVVDDFSKAKSLNGERVRFEVAGGDYRIIVAFGWVGRSRSSSSWGPMRNTTGSML